MKKLLLASVVALMGASTVNAQEYKPQAGDVTAEFVVTGGLSDTAVGFREGGIRGRYFSTNNMAYRAAVYLGTDKVTTPITDGERKESNTGFSLGLGIEKHFNGTKRLSPYIGAELGLGYKTQSTTEETEVAGVQSSTEITGPGVFNFGVKGLFGADYYFVKNVYLGVEAGLGLGFSSTGETETTITTAGTTTTVKSEGGSSLNITPSVGMIKLGFVF
ncbi:MAG: hypothetical protein CSA38_04720 [Flavobacteriales bacterium]|nr:MAG: hypothetical protein CSA38_04720 [Flavobacteriales bacterium]